MKNSIRLIICGSALGAAALSGNTPLLTDPTNFGEGTSWLAGANRFLPIATWVGFAELEPIDRVTVSGNTFTFNSWDDDTSDRIEAFLFQEFFAGPSDSPWPNTLFEAGDEIVFTGQASGVRSAPSVLARAFIKMLGFNELGWEFQTKTAHTEFFNVTTDMQDFELRVTFPDLAVDDSFQVLQIGFEIRTDYVNNVMQTGSITFSNLNAFIEGDGEPPPPPATFAGIEVDEFGNVDTGDFMGVLHVANDPWVYVFDMARWVYMPDPGEDFAGAWAYVFSN